MRQTREEKVEQIKQFALVGVVAVVCLGVLGGWFLYYKPRLRSARAEISQNPYFSRYMDAQTKLRGDFNREMTQAGWGHVMDFGNQESDKGLRTGLEIVDQAKKLVAKYALMSEASDASARQELAGMEGSPEAKVQAQEAFEKLTAKPREMVKKTWESEKRIIEEVERILKLLSRQPRAWRVVEGKILFGSATDQMEFDASIDKMAKLAKEQDALRMEAMKDAETQGK